VGQQRRQGHADGVGEGALAGFDGVQQGLTDAQVEGQIWLSQAKPGPDPAQQRRIRGNATRHRGVILFYEI
jgi:hypothetical protein